MRDDMYKVIVERPRRGSGHTNASDGRLFRNSEDVPAKLGIKQGHIYRKSLNENLAPLRRFLESQIGRPWDKVYAELSMGIDRRNTVQEHIYAHIESYVAIHTRWVDTSEQRPSNGTCVRVFGERWLRASNRLSDCNAIMYVHPLTGILLRNRYRRPYGELLRQSRAETMARDKMNQIAISANLEYHRIDDVWYAIEFAKYPALPKGEVLLVWDVLDKALRPGASPKVYAKSKRQLNSKELISIKKAHPGSFFMDISHPPDERAYQESFDKKQDPTNAQI